MKKSTEKDKQKAIKLYKEGKTVDSIVNEIDISRTTFWRWVKKQPKRRTHMPAASEEIISNAIALYHTGISLTEVGKSLGGYNRKTVAGWFEKKGIKIRRRGPKPSIRKENFFDVIDTEEKAYYLGWLMADGNISIHNNQYSIKIHISKEDEETIYSFLEAIESTNAVSCRSPIIRKGAGHKYVYTSLTSKHMCTSLINLGVIPNKTGKEQIPNIDNNLKRHFLRGFFDGDGITCVTQNKCSGFISSSKMLNEIQKLLGFNQKIHHPPNTLNPDVNYFHIGIKRSRTLYHFIYDSATVWMKRKRNRLATVCGNTEITIGSNKSITS